MPDISADVFNNLNLMAGTARSLQQTAVTPDEAALFDRDFDMLVDQLNRYSDPTIADALASEKTFYYAALQIGKGYFDNKPFGGLKAATGQFGMRLLNPQDLKQASSAQTPAYYSWLQTITTTSAKTYGNYTLGYNSAEVYTSNVANSREILAFTDLISYKPNPRVMYLSWEINDYPYVPYAVDIFGSEAVGRPNQQFRMLPIPGRVIIHPGGKFLMNAFFDVQQNMSSPSTTPSGTTSIDIQIAPFGLVIAEYDYLASGNIV